MNTADPDDPDLWSRKTFTPGPWFVDVREAEHQVTVIHRFSDRLSAVVASAGGQSSLEQMANARLIAAAPDLLAALKQLLDLRGNPSSEAVECCKRAEAAIAKAEGR